MKLSRCPARAVRVRLARNTASLRDADVGWASRRHLTAASAGLTNRQTVSALLKRKRLDEAIPLQPQPTEP
jgi:hypothetical protein